MFSNKPTDSLKKQGSSGTSGIKDFLGPGSHFDGRMTFNENMRIDGTFKGEIVSQVLLVIGDSGNLKAQVSVGSIIVSGTFEGTIKAKSKVELKAPAKVTGGITCPCVSIEEGVVFDGSVQMSQIAPLSLPTMANNKDECTAETL